MNLKSILKGCKIAYDSIQSINGLTIVPLTCEPKFSLDNEYGSPYAHKASTSTYGDLTLHRDADETKPVLVYPNSSYITNYASQDHLISKGALLKQKTANLKDSRCIQSTQSGTISASKEQGIFIAPIGLREVAFNYVGQEGYSKLWGDIERFNREYGAPSGAALRNYFSKWDKELDQFIAHFERIDNCIGFITVFNDEIVAVDKFPSFKYTSEIWNKLVRDSYASLVISEKLRGAKKKSVLKTVKDIKGTLEDVYNKIVDNRTSHYKQLLSEIVDVEFTTKADSVTPGSKILNSEGYVGQVIEDNGVNIMVSIIKKDKFDPAKMRASQKIRKIAEEQRDLEF